MPVLLLDGEDPVDFERIVEELTSKYVPCGVDQEDCVLTMAKCLWRKQRYQRFLSVRITGARFNPRHEEYDRFHALSAFLQLLAKITTEDELERALHLIDAPSAHHLRDRCPRAKFKTAKGRSKAIRAELLAMLATGALGLSAPCDELRIMMAGAVLTDDVLARELDLERECDAMFDRALDRLIKLKAAERSITLEERSRFHRATAPRARAK